MTERWRFPHADHLSPSAISEWLACPACFKLSRIDRIRKPLSVALPIGGAVHKAVESWRRSLLHDDLAAVLADGTSAAAMEEWTSEAATYFDESLDREGEGQMDLGDFEDVGKAKDEAIRLTKFVLPEIAKLDSKRGLVAAELDLKDFESPWPFPMHGRVDALYSTDGEHYTMGADLKTSKRQMAPAFDAALQLAIYERFIPGVWIADVLAKTKTPSFLSYSLTMPSPEFVYETVMDVARRIRDGDFPARPGWACKFEHGEPTFIMAASGFEAA